MEFHRAGAPDGERRDEEQVDEYRIPEPRSVDGKDPFPFSTRLSLDFLSEGIHRVS